MNNSLIKLKELINKLPELPGVYLFKNSRKRIIYVGKANSIRKRVRSYFLKNITKSYLTDAMLKEITYVDFVLVNSPVEALILENQFIKQNQPKYNVLLKDDKTYPYIALTINEKYPRAYLTRKVYKDGALYFGPYIPAINARKLLYLIYRYFGIRQCSIEIDNGAKQVCLLYHIKRCSGPCAHCISEEKYKEMVEHARMFLEGKNKDILDYLRKKMDEYSKSLQYESAAIYRDAIYAVEQMEQKISVFSSKLDDCDIFGYWIENNSIAVSILQMRKGNIVAKKEYFIRDKIWNSEETLIEDLIVQYYSGSLDIPPVIYLPKEIKELKTIELLILKLRGIKVKLLTSAKETKKELLQLAIKNAKNSFNLYQYTAEIEWVNEFNNFNEDLGLKNLINRIEAIDISHIGGFYTVGAVIVYENNGFNNKEYKRYRIRRKTESDDYLALAEILERHLINIMDNKVKKPDLIIIDGGIGQLNIADRIIKKYNVQIPVISIAKKNEEIYLQNKRIPVILARNSTTLKIIQKIRDEAHRFALKYHKIIRLKSMRESILDGIKGIGPKRKKKLLFHFKSISKIREAPLDELSKLVGKKVAQQLRLALEKIDYN